MKKRIGALLLAGFLLQQAGAFALAAESPVPEESQVSQEQTDSPAAESAPVFTWSEDYSSCTAQFPDSGTSVACTVTTEITQAATCTTVGKKIHTATVPNTDSADTKEETIPATGHKWDSGKVTTHPSCTAEGVRTYTCTNPNCGKTRTEPIAKRAHQWGTPWVSKKATPTQNGEYSHRCKACGRTEAFHRFPRPDEAIASSLSYTGSVRRPFVRVVNSKGSRLDTEHYTVSYAKRSKNPGYYAYTVTFRGSMYSGSITRTYRIRPAATKLKRVVAQKGGFAAAWKKRSAQVTGYQLQYSLRRDFSGAKSKTISSKKTNMLTVTGLKKGVTYFVRVRTYKDIGGKSIPSTWSDWVAVATRK